jgi:hypothetical protein
LCVFSCAASVDVIVHFKRDAAARSASTLAAAAAVLHVVPLVAAQVLLQHGACRGVHQRLQRTPWG